MAIPVLSRYAMVHMPDFSSSETGQLDKLVALCVDPEQPNQTIQAPPPPADSKWIDVNACPSSASGRFPPDWPATAFFNGALFSVGGQYTSMAVYYDYPNLREASMIKYQQKDASKQGFTAGLVVEERLDKNMAFNVQRPAVLVNGKVSYPADQAFCPANSTLDNVGIWHQNWPDRDACTCNGVIQPNTALNNTDTTMWAMSCHFGRSPGNSYIKAWYSTSGAPQMFYQTNAGDLDLIDYYHWQANVSYAENDPVFDYPKACETVGFGQHGEMGFECTKCHGGKQP